MLIGWEYKSSLIRFTIWRISSKCLSAFADLSNKVLMLFWNRAYSSLRDANSPRSWVICSSTEDVGGGGGDACGGGDTGGVVMTL